MRQDRVDIDALVGQQPVHLFDRVFGDQAACQREAEADRMNRQRRRPDDTECGVAQRHHAFGMHIVADQAVDELVNVVEAKGLSRFHR